MPWKKVEPMDQKIKLISQWKEGESITEICKDLGVSRKTAYKWINRYKDYEIDGLKDRSRAPHSHPNEVTLDVKNLLIAEKIKRPKWGPKKLIKRLEAEHPELNWPATSTAGSILDKSNLVQPRKKRKRVPPYTTPFVDCNNPNDVWSIDYKGQFPTGSKQICYPFTVTDNYSRFLLSVKAFPGPRYISTKIAMEMIFREYGLPQSIRSDNGKPFASNGLGGLSRLSIWWIKLGINPERIEPGKPEQNGRHERMHRTLKEATVIEPGYTLADQQDIFDQFIYEFNFERPHEAIGMDCPIVHYRKSTRDYFDPPETMDYDSSFHVLKVKSSGEIKLKSKNYYISDVLIGERIGLKKVAEDIYQIFFSFQAIGFINIRKVKVLKYTENVLPICPV